MIQIKPISDLRNKFTEIEKVVKEGSPVYLTKNGYGSMVLLSIEAYSKLIEGIETALDEAEFEAKTNEKRLSHEDVFPGSEGG